MEKLKAIQEEFGQAVFTNPSSYNDKKTPFVKGENVKIYRDTIFSRLIHALEKIYFVTKAVVGDEIFLLIAHQYVQQHPSTKTNLLNYGECFPEFLLINHFEQTHSFLPCLARFEWSWHCCVHGENNPAHDLPKLLSVIEKKQEESRLFLPKGAQLLRLKFPIINLWDNFNAELPLEPIPPQPCFYMLWQENEKMKIETLQQDEYLVLKLIEKQQALEDVCFHYQTFSTQTAMNDIFPSLCQRGCICA